MDYSTKNQTTSSRGVRKLPSSLAPNMGLLTYRLTKFRPTNHYNCLTLSHCGFRALNSQQLTGTLQQDSIFFHGLLTREEGTMQSNPKKGGSSQRS